MKSSIKKILCLILCCLCTFQLCSCSISNNNQSEKEFNTNSDNYWDTDFSNNDNSSLDDNLEPNISITVIGDDSKEQELLNEIESKKITNIKSLVYSAVSIDLENSGFTVDTGVAYEEDNSYKNLGLYYYDENNTMFSCNNLRAVGFVEITDQKEDYYSLANSNEMIFVDDVDSTDDIINICTYNYENINSYHFIYQNKYVQYYQQTDMRIVYTILDNNKSNYDLSYGSLYDYDNKQYAYDASIFGDYSTHSGEKLFSDEDYEKLENELKLFSDQQLENGYVVNEYKIVYISPESIQAYINSEEEDTFFGYSVEELTSEMGIGTALKFTGTGFETATVLTDSDQGYNWKSFLIKVGIGCGVIIVGAILTPYTGGASFGCALLTISKIAVTYAVTSAIGTIAIKTVEGLIEGKSITDTLKDATYSGLDSFANGFMIGAVIGSVGVVSGLIKPTACFIAGTPIITSTAGQTKRIENIEIGDYVLSYDINEKKNSLNKVTNVFKKEVTELVDICVNGQIITTTRNHPFYLPNVDEWVTADSLQIGYQLLLYNGEIGIVNSLSIYDIELTYVYNFTVENTHTYYVGYNGVLVHNECTQFQSKRNKGTNEAFKELKNDPDLLNKYNLTTADFNKYGRVSGYEGAHIIDCNVLKGTANEYLVSSADNVVVLTHAQHLAAHTGCYTHMTDPNIIVKYAPWAAEKVAKMLALVG